MNAAICVVRVLVLLCMIGTIISIFVGKTFCTNVRDSNGDWTSVWHCGNRGIRPQQWQWADLRAQVYVAIANFLLILIYIVLILMAGFSKMVKPCEIGCVLFAFMNFIACGVLNAWLGGGIWTFQTSKDADGVEVYAAVESYVAACVLSFFAMGLSLVDLGLTAIAKPVLRGRPGQPLQPGQTEVVTTKTVY